MTSIGCGFRFSTSLHHAPKVKMDQEKQEEQQQQQLNHKEEKEPEEVQETLKVLTVEEISDGYKKWTNEYMIEHARLMEEFEKLCSVKNNRSWWSESSFTNKKFNRKLPSGQRSQIQWIAWNRGTVWSANLTGFKTSNRLSRLLKKTLCPA